MKCAFAECLKRVELIIGDCKFCQSKFCIKHRYPSVHNCPKLEEFKTARQELLKRQLEDGKCVSAKMAKI